jgi:hypothetical protein
MLLYVEDLCQHVSLAASGMVMTTAVKKAMSAGPADAYMQGSAMRILSAKRAREAASLSSPYKCNSGSKSPLPSP